LEGVRATDLNDCGRGGSGGMGGGMSGSFRSGASAPAIRSQPSTSVSSRSGASAPAIRSQPSTSASSSSRANVSSPTQTPNTRVGANPPITTSHVSGFYNSIGTRSFGIQSRPQKTILNVISESVVSGAAFINNESSESVITSSTQSETEEAYKPDWVYRVIRSDENPDIGIFARDINAHYTPEGHIINGSKTGFKSQFISATRSKTVALENLKVRGGAGIVKIDLNKVQTKIYDLSTSSGRDVYLKGVTAKNFAKASQEVLIEKQIPKQAIQQWMKKQK
jgi:hypothetical protein